MKMNFKAKSIIKKVALVLAGITAVTAVGFGAKAIYDRAKDDLKTITPTFEVGNLGTDGKYVNDESTLYTKSAFEAEGLQIKLDFDAQINYQIFYYDDLDNFIESTAVLSAAYSETAHDGYARIVIIPTDDEDGKISLTERITYPSQMTIKVNKEQDIKYYNVFNKRLQVVDNTSELRFKYYTLSLNSSGIYDFVEDTKHSSTSMDLLNVRGNKLLTFNLPESLSSCRFNIYLFSENNLNITFVSTSIVSGSSYELNNVDYVVFEFTYVVDSVATEIPSDIMTKLNTFITLSK